jgi:hypothetical protein
MSRFMPPTLAALLLLCGPNPLVAEFGAEVVDCGNKATALVAISHDGLLTLGSAFCVDKPGLFVTTAGVVASAAGPRSVLNLVMDTGLPSQRITRAKVLRQDGDAIWRSSRPMARPGSLLWSSAERPTSRNWRRLSSSDIPLVACWPSDPGLIPTSPCCPAASAR